MSGMFLHPLSMVPDMLLGSSPSSRLNAGDVNLQAAVNSQVFIRLLQLLKEVKHPLSGDIAARDKGHVVIALMEGRVSELNTHQVPLISPLQ